MKNHTNKSLFKEIKNAVVSTTGTKLTDKDICIVLYLALKKTDERYENISE